MVLGPFESAAGQVLEHLEACCTVFKRLLQDFYTPRLKTAQKPYKLWSLGLKALKYEALEPWG